LKCKYQPDLPDDASSPLIPSLRFVYGGATNSTFDLNHPNSAGYLNVYALTIPGFVWFQSNSSSGTRRAAHACSVIGNRQMVSVGGRLPSSLQSLGVEQDPWPSGLGIFDMSAFQWSDHYDAAGGKYTTPKVIQAYYDNDYAEPSWSDSTLASVFGKSRHPGHMRFKLT
jgi:hypothetical protein